MRDVIQIATELSDPLRLAHSAISGELFRLYVMGRAPRASDVVHFRQKATSVANSALADVTSRLSVSANSIAAEARSRAHTDVLGVAVRFTANSSSKATQKALTETMCQYIRDGELLLRLYLARIGVLRRGGMSELRAVAMAKQTLEKQLRGWVKGKMRFATFALPHMLLLLTAGHLTSVAHLTYINEALRLGATRFRLVQPGHRRDGKVFVAADIPFDELHPQSRVQIVVEA